MPVLKEGPHVSGKAVGTLNLASFLQQVDFREVYNYDGSLTTPPCTEGINWLVVKKPLKISKKQQAVLVDHWAGNVNFANGFGNNRLP
jgi:carbonic anhydrase